MAAGDTRFAHVMSFFSVSGVAKRHSSATLSRDSVPSSKARDVRGRSGRAWAAAIQRRAFQLEMPRRADSHWARSRAPSERHTSAWSQSATMSSKRRSAVVTAACATSSRAGSPMSMVLADTAMAHLGGLRAARPPPPYRTYVRPVKGSRGKVADGLRALPGISSSRRRAGPGTRSGGSGWPVRTPRGARWAGRAPSVEAPLKA